MSYYMDEILLPGYTTLAECGDGGGYDWHTAAVVERDSDGALFYYEDSGCSCNYFGEGVRSEDDFTPIQRYSEAVDLAKEEGFHEDEIVRFAELLMALPAPRAFRDPAVGTLPA